MKDNGINLGGGGWGGIFVNTINYISQGVKENISEGKCLNWSKRHVIRVEEEWVCITVKSLDQIFLYHTSFLVPKKLKLRSPYERISNYPDATYIDTLPTEFSYG